MQLTKKEIQTLIHRQKEEITEYHIYMHLASKYPIDSKNNKTLKSIAEAEKRHSLIWESYTKTHVNPNWFKVKLIILLANILGITFTLKLMESGERSAQESYNAISSVPEVVSVAKEEQEHEKELLSVIEEKRLDYVSSVVLGLNDALVELTGALAGLTLAISSTKLIGSIALITGLAAAMAMSVAEYLSTKSEKTNRSPIISSLSTGLTYIITVIILTLPYFIFTNPFVCMLIMLSCVVIIIAMFTFYISVAQEKRFLHNFLEMVIITLVVAAISFGIGYFIGKVFNFSML